MWWLLSHRETCRQHLWSGSPLVALCKSYCDSSAPLSNSCLSVIPPKRFKVSLVAEEKSHLFTSFYPEFQAQLLKNKQPTTTFSLIFSTPKMLCLICSFPNSASVILLTTFCPPRIRSVTVLSTHSPPVFFTLFSSKGFSGGSGGEESPAMQETQVWSLDQDDPLEKGNGNLLQYSCLGNPMDRGAW